MSIDNTFSSLYSVNVSEAQAIEDELLQDCEERDVVDALRLMTTLATGQ